MRHADKAGGNGKGKAANGAVKAPAARRREAPAFDGEAAYPIYRVIHEDGSVEKGEPLLSDEKLGEAYRFMTLNRVLDERMITLQRQGRIGFYIGSIGEEATVLGSVDAMREQDWIFPCYREHGAAIRRGMPLTTFLCDLFGNAGDVMKGRQMPCHEAWKPGNFASISSPIATQVPQAVGAAWAARIKKEDSVSLVWFGEGATSANDFHTGMNFAGVHKIPTIFVCRNNQWAISTAGEKQTGSATFAQKAIAYGMVGERVDGNDYQAVWNATRRAHDRARAGEGPTLLECVTYRVEGHSTSDDPRAYRAAEAVEPWRKRDPLLRLRTYLTRRGAWDDAKEAALLEETKAKVLAAVKEAEAFGEKPPLETLFQDVYAEPMWQQREQREELIAAAIADPAITGSGH
jgi:2-oxoisovalerate dehydrogenase E1 component alpha subunit